MKSSYILCKKNDNLIYFYYLDNNIFYKIYDHGKWIKENILINNALDNFTISMLDKQIYIFYQNINGDIILCTTDINFSDITNKLILKKQTKNIYNMLFYPIIEDNNICLLYNTPNLDRSWKIITQIFSEDTLTLTREIDNIFQMTSSIFQIQYISNRHVLLFYKLRSLENNIGYKEITSTETSKFISIYKTNIPIIDYSFLATEDYIHSLCIMQNLFSYQLIYKKKEKTNISKPIIIFDGPKISDCLISIINNDIYITFSFQNNLYVSISKDNGDTFTKAEIFKNNCKSIEKVHYISENFIYYNNIFTKEIYIDKTNFPNIDIISNYYDTNDNKEEDIVTNNIDKNFKEEENNNSYNNIEIEKFNIEIENLKKLLLEKDEQIEYMKNVINKYKEKKSDFDIEQVNIKNSFEKEISELKNKVLKLENINKQLEKDLKNKKNIPQNKHNKNNRQERQRKK